jgi:adenylate cyclase
MPLGLVYPLLAIGLTYSAISVQHYVVEEGEKRKIRDAFGLYLSPHLARLVSERPEMLALGGEKRELTVLFSDIRGFTTMSEQLEPEALVELLNEYFGKMTDVIFSQDGTLDKYIGDAIMAVWGAPVPQSDHALRACRAAVGMVSALGALVADWRQRGLPELDIGIGINTGPMVVGNMGSARRLSYTVIGDNVNLGSRLEGLNKMYGSHIIASEATVQAARGALVARELDLVRVKGKRLPVRIYEILGMADERERWAPLLENSDAGLVAYREQRWDEAMLAFAAVLGNYPEDGPAQLYMERCRDMVAAPPESDWDGVTIMETK